MKITKKSLETALEALGSILADKNQHHELIAIGGGGLILLGLITRSTQDLDIIARMEEGELITANPLPSDLRQTIKEIAGALNLQENWINNEPSGLFEMGLPSGFKDRLRSISYKGLTLHLASRFDQICFKLYASVDQGPNSKHFSDLKLLKPIPSELKEAGQWCKTHDVSETFAKLLEETIKALGV